MLHYWVGLFCLSAAAVSAQFSSPNALDNSKYTTDPLQSNAAGFGLNHNRIRQGVSDNRFNTANTHLRSTNSQFGTSGAQFGTSGTQFGTSGTQFGASGAQFGTSGTQIGTSGAQFGSTGSQFGAAGPRFETTGSRFATTGATGTHIGGTGSRFGATGSRFGTSTGQFGTLGSTRHGTTNARFGSNTATQFGTSTNQFGRKRNQFGASGTQTQFGASGSQFGRTGTEHVRLGGSQTVPEVAILSHRSDNDGLGQYTFGYETENGISHEESGTPVGVDSYAVSGSYSYTSPEGVQVTVRYTADENGFQVDSPNVPATPPHALQQIQAAEERRRLGIPPDSGFPNDGQRSNLETLLTRSGNANFNRFSTSQDGLKRNFANSQFRQQTATGGNLQRTAVLRRPLATLNSNGIQTDAFGNQVEPVYDEAALTALNRFTQDSANFRRGNAVTPSLNSQFGQSNSRFGSSFSSSSTSGFNQDRRFNTNNNSFNRNNRQFGQLSSVDGLDRPRFQQQTASRLSIQQGSRTGRNRLSNSDISGHSDDYHLSEITSGSTGNAASYTFRS